MKQIFLILFLLGIACTAKAQKAGSCHYELKGHILDIDTKEALPYVQVKVKGTPHFAFTNIKGYFHIKGLCQQANTLIVSCFGYCDTICKQFHQQVKSPHIYLKQEVKTLNTITITAGKTKAEGTASIAQQIITKEGLLDQPGQTLASAISEAAGVTFTSTGNNVQLPVIHGLYGNRILILNNGIKHGFQNWGTDHAPEIDVLTAHKVTVVKGAAGVRYGPEALGGAVIVEANPLYLNEALKSRIGTGYQTNGRGYFANYEIGQGLKNWSYHLGANYTRTGDMHTPGYLLTNSGKHEKSVNAGLRYHLTNWDFRIYYSYVNQHLALLRSSIANSGTSFVRAINSNEPVIIRPFSYDIAEPSQLTQHHLGKIEINWRYSDEAKLTLRAGNQLNRREEYDVRRNADKPIIDLDLATNDFQLEWKHPVWLGLDGLAGLQVFTQNNDNNPGTGTTPFVPNYNTLRYSGFITESFRKGKNIYEAGIRIDYESNNVRGRQINQEIFRDQYSFANLTSSLGYIRQVSDNTTFRTNVGAAWRTPNMAELYSFGQHGFKTSFGLLRYYTNENSELRTDKVIALRESNVSPEKGYKWMNEWKTQSKTNTYTLNVYAHYIENFIFDRPVAIIGTIRGPMPVFVSTQSNALFTGSEFTWQKKWSASLNGTFGINYLWSQSLEKNESLINQPPVTASYRLVWHTKKLWKIQSSRLSVKPGYTFRQFQAPRTISPDQLIDGSVVITPESEIFDFRDAPAGYFLLDVSWKLKLNQLGVSLTVQNVLNTRYRNYLNDMRYFADEPN
jgi:iron complex outermembrane receptor protein